MKDVECTQDDGTTAIDIGSITINTSVICMSSEIVNSSATNHTTTPFQKGNSYTVKLIKQ